MPLCNVMLITRALQLYQLQEWGATAFERIVEGSIRTLASIPPAALKAKRGMLRRILIVV
jgi:hypothetical protein